MYMYYPAIKLSPTVVFGQLLTKKSVQSLFQHAELLMVYTVKTVTFKSIFKILAALITELLLAIVVPLPRKNACDTSFPFDP